MLTLGGCPARHRASKINTNDLRAFQLPRNSSHDIDSVGTTDTTCDHTETTRVGGVGVSADHETTGEGIVLEDNLVNDTRTGFPETKTVLRKEHEFHDLDIGLIVRTFAVAVAKKS